MVTHIPHWLDGAPVTGTSGRTAPVFNPSTGQHAIRDILSRSRTTVDLI